MSTTLYTPDREELAALLAGEPRYRLDQVWAGLYTQLALPADITTMPVSYTHLTLPTSDLV